MNVFIERRRCSLKYDDVNCRGHAAGVQARADIGHPDGLSRTADGRTRRSAARNPTKMTREP